MSVHALNAVLQYSESQGNDRVLMVVMADMANDQGVLWPGQGRIKNKDKDDGSFRDAALKQKCRMSESTIRRCIRRQERTGELLTIQRGRGLTNVYQILLPTIEPRFRPVRMTDQNDLTGLERSTVTGPERSTVTGAYRTVSRTQRENPLSRTKDPKPKDPWQNELYEDIEQNDAQI